MTTVASVAASTANVILQPVSDTSHPVMGAKIVDARPPARVMSVRGPRRDCPCRWMMTLNAAWYRTADWAAPASSQAAANSSRVGAAAAASIASAPATAPPSITRRGWRSSHRPTGMAHAAEASSPAVTHTKMACSLQPVSEVMAGAATRTA